MVHNSEAAMQCFPDTAAQHVPVKVKFSTLSQVGAEYKRAAK